ncbi:uncharacterized protein KY384_004970 [Bacidia gigantensis]|uniref:uncharacterized protein n=1 Tax=Bacidia gigantensis TaxID=2732470 RepID=UPI001D04F5BB|nr:uncharacterized protein KY384_004970 [Bacidia gigantensis]KAG8530467.1 hypothetical protein KY384_004970 [Bacidia gigantensis]
MATTQSHGTRSRRTSNNLGGELRGDTGANALSTLEPTPSFLPSPPLSPRPSQTRAPRRSKRRKVRSAFRRWKDFSFRHTWVNPLVLILLILAAFLVKPTSSNPLYSAIFLSYPLPPDSPLIPAHSRFSDAPTYYGKGRNDFAFVAFYIIVLSFTREFLMQRILRPIAVYYGIRLRAKQNRFMEQAYTAVYFAVFGPFGLYVMSRTPVWYFNTEGMYETYPHKSHDALFKAYYLLQASYWAQQAIVLCLQLEKPRKDFKELVGHHIVTLVLIWLSYRFHFTYMGLAVYITHDVSDFFLATSKVFNYISSPIIIPYFAFFMFVWTYLRHYINLRILYSVLTTFKTVGPFDLNWETQQYKSSIAQYITFALLASLQSMNIFWMYFIVRIALNMLLRKEEDVRDVRSDDEDDEDDEADEAEEEERRSEQRRIEETKARERVTANGRPKEIEEEKQNSETSGMKANGKAKEGVERSVDVVEEGKKEI